MILEHSIGRFLIYRGGVFMNEPFDRHAFYAGGAEGGAGGGGRWRGEHLFVVLCMGKGEKKVVVGFHVS